MKLSIIQFTFEWFNQSIIPDVPQLPNDLNAIPNMIALGVVCSIAVIFGVVYFIRLNHEARERVRILAKDLQLSNDVLITQAHTIAEANEELRATLQQISDQNTIIAAKSQDIIESIEYAKRIQMTILPADGIIQLFIPKFFCFYQPKDIVSGDFYWYVHLEPYSFLASIDCTGHGVPGAFMSVMAYNQLNQIVIEKLIQQPAEILSALDLSVRSALKQDEIGSTSKDGMDITLVRLDHRSGEAVISSAQRPYLLIQDAQYKVLKGDRFPIGYSVHDEKSFTEHTFILSKGDRLYFFSDGITDQFGGEKGRKLTPKKFEQFIMDIQNVPFHQQKIRLDDFMKKWMGKQDQLDDMMVIGIEW